MKTNFKSLKKCLSAILFATMLLCLCLGVTLTVNKASAEGVTVEAFRASAPETFLMEDGASVRIDKYDGIRFSAYMPTATYEGLNEQYGAENVSFGTFILPAKYVTKYGAPNEDTCFGADPVYVWGTDTAPSGKHVILHNTLADAYADSVGNGTVSMIDGYVLGMKENTRENLNKDYLGYTYCKINTGSSTEYVFANQTQENARSMLLVACRAIDDDKNADYLERLNEYVSAYKAYQTENSKTANFDYTVKTFTDGVETGSQTLSGELMSVASITPEAAGSGYMYSAACSTVSGKVYPDNSLVLTKSYKKVEAFDLQGDSELFTFGRYTANTQGYAAENVEIIGGNPYYKIVLPSALGKVYSVKINDTNIADFSYTDGTKTLLVKMIEVTALANGELTVYVEGETKFYSAKATLADLAVSTAEDFKFVLPYVDKEQRSLSVVLTNDISNVGEYTDVYNGLTEGWYSGTFDGKGHTISDITITRYGLFHQIGPSGKIQNVAFKNVTQAYTENQGAVIAGWNNGTIDNVYVQANVLGEKGMGGMVGSNAGTISNSIANVNTAMGDFTSGNYVKNGVYGVIFGGASSGSAVNCYGITKNSTVALYVVSYAATKTNLYSTTNGLMNAFNGTIPSGLNAYWTIDGNNNLCFGGNIIEEYIQTQELAAPEGKTDYFYFGTKTDKTANYATTYISGDNYKIDLPQAITSVLSVTINGTAISGISFSGGSLYIPVASLSGIAKGNAEMIIETDTAIYSTDVVVADYVITSAEELKTVIPYVDGNITTDYVVLGNNISNVGDYTGASGEVGFNGTFDGRGYSISGMNVVSNGMFAQILTSATIKNIAITNVTISAYAALATTLYGKVDNVYIQGSATAGAGAMIGNGVYSGTVSNCIVNVNATGAYADGNYYGLIAGAPGTSASAINVTNCYGVSTNTGVRLYSLGGYGGSPQGQDRIATTGAGLITMLGGTMSTGFNSFWKIENGEMYFGATKIIANS